MFAKFYFLSQTYAICGALPPVAFVILAHAASHGRFMVILSPPASNCRAQSFSVAKNSSPSGFPFMIVTPCASIVKTVLNK